MQIEEQANLVELGSESYPMILDLWQRAGLSIRPTGRDSEQAFARQMAWGVQRVAAFRAADRLLAVVVLTHDGRKGWINRLAVDPVYRRLGLATRLLAEAERWFSEELGLEVWAALIEDENATSRALFAHLDYRSLNVQYVTKRLKPDA